MTDHPQLNVRVDDAFLERLDDWRRKQKDLPNRPEAVRRLVDRALGVAASKRRRAKKPGAARAATRRNVP